MRRYLTRCIGFLAIAVIFVTVIATLYLNRILAKSKEILLQRAQKYIAPFTLSVENIIYCPPHFIIAQNVSLFDESVSVRTPFVSVTRVVARFSLSELLTKKRLQLYGISLYAPQANYTTCYTFLEDNFKQILEFIKRLPRQDITLAIKEAHLETVHDNESTRYINADFFLRLAGDLVFGYGKVSEDKDMPALYKGIPSRQVIKGVPFQYKFRALVKSGGFSIENVEYVRENSYVKLWGDSSGSILQLNGFAFIDTLFEEGSRKKSHFNIKEYLLRRKTRLPSIDLSKVNMNILDIDCRLKAEFPHFEIERLSFTLNNNPVSVKGNLAFSRPVSLGIQASLSQSEKQVMENPKKLGLKVQGIVEHNTFRGSARLNFDFVKKKKANPPLESLELNLKGLALYLSRYPRLSMALGELSLGCVTETNTYSILLNDAHAVTDLREGRQRFIRFHSSFYDGLLKGWGGFDTGMPPARISSHIYVTEVTANKLEGLLIHFSKVYGKLSGQMYFSTYPSLSLKGALEIHNGYLRDFEFFKWLADFFALASLRRVDFDSAVSNFTIDEYGAGLQRIELDSKDVDLSGYFSLGANDLVASKISLSLTRELLKESPKFSRLLKLVGEDLESLRFNFQLSGILHAMNFQWLKSDLKKELQDRIPNFIERKIERGVEEAIESVSEKEKE